MALIWCVGFLIMLNSFNHVVVNGAEILMAMLTGNELVTVDRWLARSFLPTLLGNMIGGLVFVTLLEYLKVMRSAEKWL
jgi:formate/nitrite transporter FocA (FNT family)